MNKLHVAVATFAWVATIPSLAFAERLLVQDHDASVYLQGESICGAPARIRVTSNNADIFSGDSIELQRYTDVARAIIGFECTHVSEVAINGHLTGIIQPVFTGVANASTGWLLRAQQSISTASVNTPQITTTKPATYPDVTINQAQDDRYASGSADDATETFDSATNDQYESEIDFQDDIYSVAGLQLGMQLDTAMNSVRELFKQAPRYDSAKRLLTVEEGGCYAEYNWDKRPTTPLAGWRCLRAKFDDNPNPAIQHLTLTQVASENKNDEAYQALIERFGQPDVQKETNRAGDPFGIFGKPVKHLAWGESTTNETGKTEHELEAIIENWRDVTILTLNLNDTGELTPTADNTAQAFQF